LRTAGDSSQYGSSAILDANMTGRRQSARQHHTLSYRDAAPRATEINFQTETGPYPRPTNGIFVAITVINKTLASSGSPAM
jgi:hypothetical protein